MAEIAGLGFRAVIDNRPDGEGGAEQPTAGDLLAAAQGAGLSFVYQPVVGSEIDTVHVAQFADYFAALPKPVLAFCRSGARSLKLRNLAKLAEKKV